MITAEALARYDRHGVTVDDDGRWWARRGRRKIRVGAQAPTFARIGPYESSMGADVVDLFEDWGASFYPSQADEMELFLARDGAARFACKSICISKPRQNGKSFGARKYAEWMAAGEGKKVLYSAHNGSTVRKMFKFVRDDVLNNPELREELEGGEDGIYSSKGSEGVYFRNGGCIEFQTRTSSGALGTTYDVIVVDEAQQLTWDQMDAIKPTTIASESGDPQMIYIGTPPKPTEPGEVFRDFYDQAHADAPCDIWWLEWSVPEPPAKMGDVDGVLELAWQTNPAMGLRIKVDVMRDAITSYRLRPDSYARQYLGWWSPVAAGEARPPIAMARWNSLVVEARPAEGDCQKVAYGVKFTHDGTNVALSACAIAGKTAHVSLIREVDTSEGIGWLVAWIAERRERMSAVAIDGKADAQDLEQRLREARVPRRAIQVVKPQDLMSAAGMLVNAVNDGTLTHVDDVALAASVQAARRRKVGNAGGFAFEGDFSERLESCALAHWAARTTKRDPKRRTVVR